MSVTLDELRAERLLKERRRRRITTLLGATVVVTTLTTVFVVRSFVTHGPVASARIIRSATVTTAPSTPAPVVHTSVGQTLQDATGLAASLLASTRDTEVARSALVAAQKVTGCAPEEGGPALVHLNDATEKAAELASRADFYATARQNGRTYATHARAYIDSRTVVYVAVAWECPSAL
jgi:hypothetical protein